MATPKKLIEIYRVILDSKIKCLQDVRYKKSNYNKELLKILKNNKK